MRKKMWFIYNKKDFENAHVSMYGEFIGGYGDKPGHWSPYNWKVKASFFRKEKYYEREWLFEISDSLDNTKTLKKKVLDFYGSLDSELSVAEAVESAKQKVE